jgi:hypothetical protein
MAYNVEALILGVTGKRLTTTNGTGTGTLYVLPITSADGAVNVAIIFADAAPSTTDTYGVGSLWVRFTAGAVVLYLKTAATTWVDQK